MCVSASENKRFILILIVQEGTLGPARTPGGSWNPLGGRLRDLFIPCEATRCHTTKHQL